MLQMCDVSQDLRRFRAVVLVLRTDQDKLQSLMPFKHLPFFAFPVALDIRAGSFLCYVDTAETLASRDSGKCVFLLIRISVLEDVSIFSTNLDVDGPVLLGLVEVDGTVTLVLS